MDRLAGPSTVIEEVILRFVLGSLNSWVLWATEVWNTGVYVLLSFV